MGREQKQKTKQNQIRAMTPERRKRINRLKKMILRMVVFMFLFPTICCIILGIILYRKNKTVDTLEKKIDFLEVALQNSMDTTDRLEALLKASEEVWRGGNAGTGTASEEELAFLPETEDVYKSDVVLPEGRKAYLTFDDGPSVYTAELLDILAEYQVKATFFVTGKRKEQYGYIYRRIVEEGHTLGMHSYSHEYNSIYASLENFQNDLETLQNFLYQETGVTSHFYRFPGGSSNQVSQTNMRELTGYLKEKGISYFDWNISAGDATSRYVSSEQIVNNVVNALSSHRVGVILLHDAADKRSTVDALPKLIEEIQKMDQTEILPITKETLLIQHAKNE